MFWGLYVKHSAYFNKFTWAVAWDLKLLVFGLMYSFIFVFGSWWLISRSQHAEASEWKAAELMGHEDVTVFEGSHTLYSRVSQRHSLPLFLWFYCLNS